MTDLTPEALAALDRAYTSAAKRRGVFPQAPRLERWVEGEFQTARTKLLDALLSLHRAGLLVHVDAIKGDRHE